MQRNFWKASLVSLAAYPAGIVIGFWSGFRFLLFAVPVFQIVWTLFCVVRIVELRRGGGHKADAPQSDRESYGFALGGSVSSAALLVVLVILTQIV
jgi:hypothetical protein